MSAILDNDVLFKSACYGLLGTSVFGISLGESVGILGSARFVIAGKIQKASLNGDRARALENFLAFLSSAETLEPTDDEQEMAADLELAAQTLAVNLDSGESQLCAILVLRAVGLLLTGDKRAIVAIESLLDADPRLTPICGRVRCLEQVFADAVACQGHLTLRLAICAEPQLDRALSICFSCTSLSVERATVLEGLLSYINDLRRRAARVLAA